MALKARSTKARGSARRKRPDVSLATVEAVRTLLESANEPLSRNALLAALQAKNRSTTRQRLNRALGFFFDLELAFEGSKGIQWTRSGSESLRDAVATGRRL